VQSVEDALFRRSDHCFRQPNVPSWSILAVCCALRPAVDCGEVVSCVLSGLIDE
jgi:hypothetical protein